MFKNILILILSLTPFTSYAYECNKEIDQISAEYNIKIICNISSLKNGLDSDVSGINPGKKKLEDFAYSLKKFVSLYPKKFLSSKIRSFILLEQLKLNGSFVGGLSDGKDIYIRIGDFGGETRGFYAMALNHEFSTNILRSSSYTKKRGWERFSEGLYDDSHSFLIKNLQNFEFSRTSSPELFQEGFLFNYSKTDSENDFNTYAECIFKNEFFLKRIVNKYPLIKKKIEFLKSIYREAGFVGNFPDETWHNTITGLV